MILLPVVRENADTCSRLDMDSPNKMSARHTGARTGVKFPVSLRPGEEPCCGNKDTAVPCSRIAWRHHSAIIQRDIDRALISTHEMSHARVSLRVHRVTQIISASSTRS